MGVTFLIGNGFDLNLGMKTRYTDMYDSYIKSKSKSTVIDKFKKDLQKEEHNHYENWSDFEMGMARYAQNFTDENEFIECIWDFKAHMVDCLKKEDTAIINKINSSPNTALTGLIKTLQTFHRGSTRNITYEIEDIIYKNKYCPCSFITFNYTKVLDRILNMTPEHFDMGDVIFDVDRHIIHVHGSVDYDVVLGVDNKSQISNNFRLTRNTELAFIKPEFNKVFDYRRVDKAIDMINKSSVICAFGLSLGESDKTWIDVLKEWLLTNDNHHLIYYVYDENEIPLYNYDMKIQYEEALKNEFFKKLKITDALIEKIRNRVHIPVSYKIFDFKIQEKGKELAIV